MDSSLQPLTISSYLSLVFFLLAIVFVIFPLSIGIPYSDRFPVIPIIHPKHGKKIKIRINLATAPLIAIVILLATKSIGFQVVVKGFLGTEGIQPYSIMILFYALAYICISLDVTGFVECCAYAFSNKSGKDGRKLFTYFYILFNLMSAFTSNDVVVLTGTIFLVYYTKISKIKPPTAFLISEFVAANIASMTLYIGNPTNVIVAQAYGITFLTYSAWMILPTITAMILAYFALYTIFRRSNLIPDKVNSPKRNPSDALKDKTGAIFGVIVLGSCLITLMGTSFTSLSVWIVTLPFAVIMLIRDIWYDLARDKTSNNNVKDVDEEKADIETIESERVKKSMNLEKNKDETKENNKSNESLSSDTIFKRNDNENEQIVDIKDDSLNNDLDENNELEKEITMENNSFRSQFFSQKKKSSDLERSITTRSVPLSNLNSKKKKPHSSKEESFDLNRENDLSSMYKEVIPEPHDTNSDNDSDNSIFKNTLPTVYSVVIRMPGNLLPFALGMFILVEALSSLGWISRFAIAISALTPTYPVAVISIAIISIILCNFLNNLPMTVLLSRILQDENFAKAPHVIQTPAIKQGCIYALIIGSNIGACLTIVGALAGFMWDKILKDKGQKIGYWQFVKWNLGVLPVITVGACGVLIMELWVYYDKLNN
ncbi:arsenical pump membrane protein-domain-containing protein [Gigaspora margarita]|uniref:Arsenical pump membrane protein-domain-containing protein n=1 Tax=Gigaspora margarita TaxID=4874 RepID=A0A8H4EV28_GIGMA|nr:arsenical pump membrane protein-domain-containing protein [Gigaspora margarita]